MIKKMTLCLYAIVAFAGNMISQGGSTFINREFQSSTGSPVFNPVLNPFGVQWSKSIESAGGGLITVGHTTVSGQGENVLLTRYGSSGSILFQVNYNTSGTQNDYGISVVEDAGTGNIFVCGTTDNGGSTNYDAVILCYNSSGTLLYSTTYVGPSNLNDIAVSIIIHPISGEIIVAASSENSGTYYDYLVLKYNATLSLMGSNTYDYANLIEVPSGIEFSSGGDICLIGASASSLTNWDYAIAVFDQNTLAYISDTRSSIIGVGYDQPLSFCKDASQNIYITGRASTDGINYNIRTIKILANLTTIAWSQVYDGTANLEDAGNTIAVDQNGDVIVGGFSTGSNGKKNILCQKYNGSTGSITWQYDQASEDPSGDAFIKTLGLNSTNGNIYFVAGEKNTSGKNQSLVGKVSNSGGRSWQKAIQDPSIDILPSDLQVGSDGIYVISILSSSTNSYITTKYSELALDSARTFSGSNSIWKKRELIVSFIPSAINKSAIDNQVGTAIKEFGDLSDYLTVTANNAVNIALEGIIGDGKIKAIKIFDGQKTTDTLTINRLGENTPIPPFWSTLLLQIPDNLTLQQVGGIFQSLPSVASYAHPNYFVSQLSPPNDSLYSLQTSLHGTGITNINVEDAWTVSQGCGSSFIKGGIFDSGLEWRHKDFGYNGSPTSGKAQGWHWDNNVNFPSSGLDLRTTNIGGGFTTDGNGHGTNVAGIIGAERNNTSGVAGIAGGDASNANPGVSLYSLNTSLIPINFTLKALYETSLSGPTPSNPYRYGLNFSNHSYKLSYATLYPDSFAAFREQVYFANRMKVTFIAARGNDSSNAVVYPACFDTSWVISVGGVGSSPAKWSGSSYGKGVDIVAPALASMIRTTNVFKSYDLPVSNGTSFSAPHVSGVVALLMSYMNDPTGLNPYVNLAPEDCEYIIQHSASDLYPYGHDSLTGYGMLHAGNALRMVEKPVRILYHYGTNYRFPYTISKSLYSSVDTVVLTETYKNELNQFVYSPGIYIVKTYQIDVTVNHSWTYPTDSILHHWARHSSSYVFDLFNGQKKITLHPRVKFTSFSPTSASLRGYIYEVKGFSGNPLGWWPCDTSFSALYSGIGKPKTLIEYSIISRNNAVGIKENKHEDNIIQVFPNPANQQQTLIIDSKHDGVCTIDLFDLMGRHVRKVYDGRLSAGKTSILHSIDDLPNSMYIYVIRLDNQTLKKKFIKE